MAKYKPKSQTVDAVDFTPELGAEIAAACEKVGEKDKPKAHPTGVTFEPGVGYRIHGQTLRFGDVLVTSRGNTIAMTRKDFESTYEATK